MIDLLKDICIKFVKMEDNLRSECQNLLEQLRMSQKLIKDQINGDSGQKEKPCKAGNYNEDPIHAFNMSRSMGKRKTRSKFGTELACEVNVSRDADTDLKPTYARSKLSSLSSSGNVDPFHCQDTSDVTHSVKDCSRGKENHNLDTSSNFKDTPKDKETMHSLTMSAEGQSSEWDFDQSNDAFTSSSWQPATPNTQRRRQIIDKHTSVPTKLDAKELQELNKERLLNFSYSHINVDDNVLGLKTHDLDAGLSSKEDPVKSVISKSLSTRERLTSSRSDQREQGAFEQQLNDDGNNRKLNGFIRDTTIKPKSILNSTAYYSLNSSSKNNSRVRFKNAHSIDQPAPDHHLLGYDWIAALLDNDSGLNDQSESFFDDIKDFRRAYKDECCNKFYMEGPYTLVDYEPEPVVEALTEPKVRPYVVNERLFTEPFRPDLIDYDDDDGKPRTGSKDPTKDNPRFVRVSIPRSTLQTPYRVKPHRRGSFDGADSCALMDHCLLGWENSRPAMLPSAQTLDLNTQAGTRVDSQTTTLAEAERQANDHHRSLWPFAKPTARQQTLPTWSKQYMNTTLSLSLPSEVSERAANLSGSRPADIKRATDRLLSSTYSTMYEMERLRQERELERRHNAAELQKEK